MTTSAKVLFVDYGTTSQVAALIKKDLGEKVATFHCQSQNLTPLFLSETGPDCLIFALFGPALDAYQMIALVMQLNYRGALLVIAPALGKPAMVERELRALGPGARLTLVSLGTPQPE